MANELSNAAARPKQTGPFAVIFNPSSNRRLASKFLDPARRAADRLGLDAVFRLSPSPEELGDLVIEEIARGRVPVAMGGDGTVNMVARAVLDHFWRTDAGSEAIAGSASEASREGDPGKPRTVVGGVPSMGILACGTGNDTAASLGLPVKDIEAALGRLTEDSHRDIDVLRVASADGSTGVSLAVLAAGFDSEVTEAAERIKIVKGPLRYTLAVFSTLARSSPAKFTLAVDDQEPASFEAWLVAVANGPRYGGGMHIAPSAVPDDGIAHICVVGPVSKPHFVRTFPKVFKGAHIDDPAIRILEARRLRLEATREFRCYGDGERIGPLPITVEVLPRSLRVLGARPPSGRNSSQTSEAGADVESPDKVGGE